MAVQPTVREIGLSEIDGEVQGGLTSEFMALHAEWTGRGLTRWLSLLRTGGARPVLVMGAFDGTSGALIGAVIGVWNHAPCERFDDLLESATGFAASSRPAARQPEAIRRPHDGAWHLIAVTTSDRAQVRNLGLGRLLLGCILSALAATGHALVRTMSPALGLVELAQTWPDGDLTDAVLHAARRDGRPALQVMRLHLGGGATLERVLRESRRDDRASGGINLRFCYATDPAGRVAQRERWGRWIASRAADLRLVTPDFLGAPLYRASAAHDALVWHGPNG